MNLVLYGLPKVGALCQVNRWLLSWGADGCHAVPIGHIGNDYTQAGLEVSQQRRAR